MKYLECRYDRYGFGTYIKAQIKTDLYDYYIIFDGFDTGNIEPDKIVYRDEFLNNRMGELNKEDIVVITCNDLKGLPGIEDSKCTKILTLHDVTPLRVRYLSKAKKSNWRNMVKKAVEVCDYIITVSNFSKDDIQKEFNISGSKIFVVYNYAQKITEMLNEDDADNLRDIYDAKYVIATVGSMSLNKNFIRTALAWKRSKYFRKSVMIVMSKKNSIAFKLLLALLGVKKRVVVPGYVPLERLASLYYVSDLFIFTTIREGFGIPPLEAMALDTPVLTSNTSCMEEVLGDAAVYVNPYKIRDISRGIEKLLDNKKLLEKLIEKGRRQTKLYSPDRFKSQMLCVFEELQ